MVNISIITINYNNASGLQKTIASVTTQTFTNFEFIIIDGGSVDESKNLIDQNSHKISHWVSEKDEGIYNAMNKGLIMATGEYVIFMNSGDTFSNENILKEINPLLGEYDLVYGDLKIVETQKKWIKKYDEKLSLEYFTRDTLPHQGTFIKRSLFHKIGFYDETLKIVADWKFFVEAVCIYKATTLYLNKLIADYDYTGISAQPEFYKLQDVEKQTILNNLFPLQIDAIRELQQLRERKKFFESFENDFLVKKYFALKLKLRALKKGLTK